MAEVLTFHKLHHQVFVVFFLEIITHERNALVASCSERLGFSFKCRGEITSLLGIGGFENDLLQRNGCSELLVRGFIDCSHSALPKLT